MSIEHLRRQRGSIKAKLTATKNFVNRAAEEPETTTKEEIESRLQNLEEAHKKFQAISQQLLSLTPEDEYETKDAPEETEFDDRYFAIKAELLKCLDKFRASSRASIGETSDSALAQVLEQQVILMQRISERSTENSGNEVLSRILEQQGQLIERLNIQPANVREPQVKLPMINLPTFNGDIEEWKRYADTFKTLVHDTDLSDVQKHQYLVGSLSGPAARVIESIQISGHNYTIAWELLKKRYEDERVIRKRHIQCLFEIPRVHRESASAIRELVDHVQKHLRVLQSLNLPTESWGELIAYLIEKNLDNVTRRRWEEHAASLENLTTENIIEFLQLRCQVLERASLSENSGENKSKHNNNERSDHKQKQPFQSKVQGKTSLSTTIQGRRCCLCQDQHMIYSCSQFLNLSVENRIQTVKRLKLCINCLRNDHHVANCTASACRECGGRHNTLCHRKTTIGATADPKRNSETPTAGTSRTTATSSDSNRQPSTFNVDTSSGPSVHHVKADFNRKRVLMSTAIVHAKGGNNYNFQLRVLLDSASEANFITLASCKKLGLNLDNIVESINGLGNMNCTIKNGCKLQLKSRTSDFELSLYCLVVPKITKELPSFSIKNTRLPIPENLKLADPLFYNPSNIDVLIGGEFFLHLLENGKIELSDNLPTLQNSKFGWIVAGSIPEHLIDNQLANRSSTNVYTCLAIQQDTVNDTLSRFWELEEYSVDKHVKLSREELECENHFVNTTTRDPLGRYVVKLPFRENKTKLGGSKEIALKRFNYLERKFYRDRDFYKQYSEFMQEYIQLNHMSISTEELNKQAIYLPHHGVLRETSLTTKLRVVFDGSAKTSSGISLNETLMVGANLQDNIIDIILRFRLHAIAITADLKKMYRQILIHEDDRKYQKILWRFSTSEPVREFTLNTVTYGLACAPFLAIRCVRELASNASDEHSEAAHVLLNDLYVDDILTGVNSMTDASNFIAQLKILLNSGGFEPHKWRSNCKVILQNLDSNERVDDSLSVASDASSVNNVRTPGLNWQPERDIFEFSIDCITTSSKTKREVLSAISRLFDPLGLVSPILIRAKLIMQATWAANLDWDETLTTELQQAWCSYADDLNSIYTIQIPRRVISDNNATRFYLHAFCDASLKAYGACIYLQTANKDNKFSSALLCSKSRVAPTKNKTITLPRLELCGALVLVRLLKYVRAALKIEFDAVHAWSDSTIALAWISGDPSRQKMFISNRTAEIQSILPSKYWHHVKSKDNPADLISRGTSLKDLTSCKLWWEGPSWLAETNQQITTDNFERDLSQSEIDVIRSELKLESHVFVNINNSRQIILCLLQKCSSLSRLERIISRIYRFIFNCKSNVSQRKVGDILLDEIENAHRVLIKEIQGIFFAEEVLNLREGREIKSTSKLLCLSPFLDKNGVLRVGGRIQNSIATFNTKHPILLPSGSRFTRLLFEREHRRLLHAGPQALLYAIRGKYWPIRGKTMAKRVVHDCMICYRNKPKPLSQIMGSLPTDRVVPTRPFFATGIDFAGPITTLVNRGRGRKTNKSYISLFICLSTRAIHVDAVSDLSSNSFIAALRRFVGRRGCPQRIYSDNATNFVGARNELREVQQFVKENYEKVNDEFCIPRKIEWKFIPPSAPHMGGLWEAGVKSCKFHLKRVVGQNLLTFEELTTVLIQIEACLNSRPICQLPSTPDDLQPLTPGHFLIGEPLMSVPEYDLSDVPINRVDRWQLIQKITQDFWRRWSQEYLTSLQGKTKWRSEQLNLAISDLVLIQDNTLPPLKWKMGKVIEVHAGSDGKVRVATLKTMSGICKRPIAKLCKLPTTHSLTECDSK